MLVVAALACYALNYSTWQSYSIFCRWLTDSSFNVPLVAVLLHYARLPLCCLSLLSLAVGLLNFSNLLSSITFLALCIYFLLSLMLLKVVVILFYTLSLLLSLLFELCFCCVLYLTFLFDCVFLYMCLSVWFFLLLASHRSIIMYMYRRAV